jgi:hypothetical protein
MIKPCYEDFRYSGVSIDNLEIDDEAVQRTAETRTRIDAESHDGQSLGVFTVTPDRLLYPEIIVRSTAFSDDNGRPEGALFDAYLAEATHRRVMSVNMPGIDYFTEDMASNTLSRLTPDQLEELRMYGSFRKVGESSMRALQNAAVMNGEHNPSFIVTASSMGVAVAAGMIRESFDKNMDVTGVVFAEPVNHVKRPLAKLGWQFAMTNATAPGYVAVNPEPLNESAESMGFWFKRVLEGRTANWAYARALGAGTLLRDLGPIDGLADTRTPLYVTRGTASRLSSDKSGKDFTDFLEHLEQIKSLEHDTFEGHDHPYTMTVQSVIDGVAKITNE